MACSSAPVAPETPKLSPSDFASQYRLGASDQIRITVFNQPNLSGEFVVDGTGFIALPLSGPIKAGDKTVREIEKLVAETLNRGGFLVNPSVAVQVIQYRPYYILGEVAQPGAYPYTTGLTVRNAVAAARGFTYRANTRRVYIQSAGDSKEELYELTPGTMVWPGDTIRIPERLF
jgi:polysaccharide export outer membrane protein